MLHWQRMMNCKTFISLVAFAASVPLWFSGASSGASTQSLPLKVVQGEGGQCPSRRGAESLDEVLEDVSTLLQDVVRLKLLGTAPEYAGHSCTEIAEKAMSSPSGNYYILNSTGSAVQVYCEMGDVFPGNLNVTNGWVRVVNLNMTDPDQQCPGSLQTITDPVRACGKSTEGAGCDSVKFTTYGIQYQQVCGRVRGYQFYGPDAFASYFTCEYPCNDIDAPYVDGVSITHGNPRQHVWTYAVGLVEQRTVEVTEFSSCPCTGTGRAPPNFVGNDYSCESGLFQEPWSSTVYSDDPLWDGQDCDGDEGTCCDPPNLPWFCKNLSQPTNDDLEVRLCMDQILSDENIFADLVELYVQ